MAIQITCPTLNIDQTFTEDLITIGRGAGNMIQVQHPKVSSLHGQIVRREGEYFFQDLKSTNGSMLKSAARETILDGVHVREVLIDRDEVELLLGDTQQPVRFLIRRTADPISSLPSARTVVASRSLRDAGQLAEKLLQDQAFDHSKLSALLEILPNLQQKLEAGSIASRLIIFLFKTLPSAQIAGIFFRSSKGLIPLLLRTRKSHNPLPVPWSQVKPLFEDALKGRSAMQIEDPHQISKRLESSSRLRVVLACPFFERDTLQGLLLVAGARPFAPHDLDWVTLLSHQAYFTLRNAQFIEERVRLQRKLQDENTYLKETFGVSGKEGVQIIGDSPALKRVLHQVQAVARTDTSVLILGETGTGKELIAQRIHKMSQRAHRIFAAVNCGALSETLLESELFGHVRGAFTGATRDKKGLLQVADSGTLFLDEFGEISPRLQVKLLRVLENGEITPVGSARVQQVNVRLISATNKDLQAEVEAGRFREDLFYRVNVFPIHLPPLRERIADIRPLAEHFLKIFNERFRKNHTSLSDRTIEKLEQYNWPGNIRQLQNEIERATLMAEDDREIAPEDLSERIGGILELPVEIGPLREAMSSLEKQYVRRALKQHNYNRTHTAQTLGISRQALTVKLNKYNLIHLKAK